MSLQNEALSLQSEALSLQNEASSLHSEAVSLQSEALRATIQAREMRSRTRFPPGAVLEQFENNYFTEMCSSSEEGSYLRLIDFCITHLLA